MAFLGVEDGLIYLNDNSSWNLNKIGGYPDWMKKTKTLPCCPNCENTLLLIVQLYCPLGDSHYHRTLYIFACGKKSCWSAKNSWMVLRSQLPDESRLPTKKQYQDKKEMFEIKDDWGVDDDDWGDEKQGDFEINDDSEWDLSDSASELVTKIHPSNQLLFEERSGQERNHTEGGFENRKEKEGNKNSSAGDLNIGIENLNISHDGMDSEIHAGQMCDCLVARYVNVIDEPSWSDNNDNHVQNLLREYERTEGSVMSSFDDADCGLSLKSDEKYEKDDIRHGDKVFHHFTKKVSVCPQQCIRYHWNGTPLYICTPTPDILHTGKIPCKYCGAPSVFELQLMPALVNYLKLPDQSESALEFGTVLVYTCKASCWSDSDTIRHEMVVVQMDPDQHLFK